MLLYYYMEDNNLVSIAEYIKHSGHAPQNVYRWIRERRITPTYITKTIEVACLPKDLIIDLKWHPKEK